MPFQSVGIASSLLQPYGKWESTGLPLRCCVYRAGALRSNWIHSSYPACACLGSQRSLSESNTDQPVTVTHREIGLTHPADVCTKKSAKYLLQCPSPMTTVHNTIDFLFLQYIIAICCCFNQQNASLCRKGKGLACKGLKCTWCLAGIHPSPFVVTSRIDLQGLW